MIVSRRHSERSWKDYVELDTRYLRRTEVDHLHGDAIKPREKLGWKPRVEFKELIEMMNEEDDQGALAGRAPKQ